MRIALSCPDEKLLTTLEQQVNALGSGHDLHAMRDGLLQSRSLIIQSSPDVLVVTTVHAADQQLMELEMLALHLPELAIILISNNRDPDFLVEAMRASVREVLPLPLPPDGLKETLLRIEHKRVIRQPQDQRGKILSLIGCKGGAGTTFLATNLAYALAVSSGKKIALFDLDRQFGDALYYISDQEPIMDIADISREIHRLDASLLDAGQVHLRSNLSLLPASQTPEKINDVQPEQIAVLLNLAATRYDFVIVDLGRVIDIHTATAMDESDQIFPILNPSLPFLRSTQRLLQLLAEYPPEKVRIIVNRMEKRGELQLRDIEETLQVKAYRTFTNQYQVALHAINQGEPLHNLAPKAELTQEIRSWALSLLDLPDPAAHGGWLNKLLHRGN